MHAALHNSRFGRLRSTIGDTPMRAVSRQVSENAAFAADLPAAQEYLDWLIYAELRTFYFTHLL